MTTGVCRVVGCDDAKHPGWQHPPPPVELRDSRRRWAVLVLVANSGKVLPEDTRYFRTRWGARRYVRRMGEGPMWRLKVVRNA